jgi:zinc protease
MTKVSIEVYMQRLQVIKQVLANGLTVLISPRRAIPKVSTQLWYNVGSKDERSGEKGIAHLIEHMIFKGTGTLSECDINLITHKLSGYCNAFTSYDYTGYLFDFPSQHWQEALPIMADCMRNCTFKEEFLNSELKAVIQELKMYRDDYLRSVIEYLLSAIFNDHPYHHPIIGYKQDLWGLKREALVSFYQHHYVPNNATLVVVGDVDTESALKDVHKAFGNVAPDPSYKKAEYYHSPDLRTYDVTVYRDVKQPMVVLAWVVPGAQKGQDYLIDIVLRVIGYGKGSRLYKKLVDGLQLVTELEMFNYTLFEHGVIFLYFQPKEITQIEHIISIIHEELHKLMQEGVQRQEITRAIKKTEVEYLALLENNQKQAYGIGEYYLATRDEQFFYTYTDYPKSDLEQKVQDFVSTYLRSSLTHSAHVLPLKEDDKKYWLKVQEISDEEDARILAGKIRHAEVEEGKCVHSIEVYSPKPFDFPKSHTTHLSNGLKVLHYGNPQLPKIDLIIDFKAKYNYDPQGLEGLSSFTAAMLLEGTKNYTASEFADVLESYGMSLYSTSGQITLSMLSQDLPKGLELIHEILTQASFNERSIEKVRDQMIADLQQFLDTPSQFATQLARQEVYKEHPYSKNVLGTFEGVKAITREKLLEFYTQYLSPRAARLGIVGDLEQYNVKEVLEHMLSRWQGPEVLDLDYPVIPPVHPHDVNYHIMRDQIVLCYAGLSVTRTDPDYDKLLLFDQIFGGGVLNSMSSRLFDLRERSGLFYTISGSLISRVDEQKGMIIVKTIVSPDRLKEAEHAIEKVIDTAVDTVEVHEFEEAQRAVANSLVDNFGSNYHIALTSLFKDKFQLPTNYFDNRAAQLSTITITEMQEVVRKYLSTKKLIKVRVGRV